MTNGEKRLLLAVLDDYTMISDEGSKEIDDLGYADRLKRCAEMLFCVGNNMGYHFEDIEYMSEYFMIGTGTNSIVNFHIKECPGWLFGIWWTIPSEKDDDEVEFNGDLFAQYEETINKFKPYTSIFRDDFYINLVDEDKTKKYLRQTMKMISFIHKEPALAFCRDRYALDYNYEYYTREKAQEIFDKCMRGEEVEWETM